MLSKNDQKFIKSLKIKKYRTREKRFLVEGAKNVLELLGSSFSVDLIVATEAFYLEYDGLLKDVRIECIGDRLLAELGSFKTNSAALAIAQMKDLAPLDMDLEDHLFVLDGVGDPGNLGTIIRTMDWFGYKNLLCSPTCAEFYQPKVISSTMGSFTRINIHYGELADLLQGVKFPVIAADLRGVPIGEFKVASPSIIVMGSESHGISEPVANCISERINIPKYGAAESLNVGIAAGILANHFRMSK